MMKRNPSLQLPQEEGSSTSQAFVPYTFDQSVSRTKLARMIIIDELPFKLVEGEGFRDFAYSLRPEFQIPSRVTVAKDCFKLFLSEKEKLKTYFKHSKVRVCLTTDIWASSHHVDYMCLTAHFIDRDWQLQKRILNFAPISDHTGITIAKAIETHLIDWGIGRILTVTVDNASANDWGMAYLRKRLNNWKGSVLKGEHIHMRCCAHILSLIVKEGLKVVDDSIYRVRSAVKYVRSSNSRIRRFQIAAREEKIESKRTVCGDVETRWNSTYFMLDCALIFQKAFDRLEEEDPKFRTELEKLKGTPREVDWDYVRSLLPFLKQFYHATLKVSGTLYVTSDEYFHVIYGISCKLKDQLSSSTTSTVNIEMAKRMKTKHDKYWGNVNNINPLLFVALILDPRFKVNYMVFVLELVYEAGTIKELVAKVSQIMHDLFDYYSEMNGVDSGRCTRSEETQERKEECDTNDNVKTYLRRRYKRKRVEDNVEEASKSELQRYLESEGWKVNSSKYPILAMMARDVLAIPVSTVASESAFSTGGRVLDVFRSSLSPLVVESLICAQNWIRSSTAPINMEETFEELEELEQGKHYVSSNIFHSFELSFILRLYIFLY
ncbi:Putative AC transposase [Linum grandiflorum]